jgi:hypothetical protein
VWNERVKAPLTDPLSDYSQFLDAWKLVDSILNSS